MNNWFIFDIVRKLTQQSFIDDTKCSICGKSFTDEEWDERHSDEDGEDCHEYCCPICNK